MKTISIIIPVFNEEQRLHKTFSALEGARSFDGISIVEIIFVNDGSTDSSLSLLKETQSSLKKLTGAQIHIISYTKNKGKGKAIKEGMFQAQGDYALLMDADIATPLSELKKFIPLMHIGIDIIIGTRKSKKATIKRPQPVHRQILGHIFTYIANITLGTNVSDFTCGFKLFSRKAYTQLFPISVIPSWGYDSEILFIATQKSIPVYEIPVRWNHVKGSKVSVFANVFTTLKELASIRLNSFAGVYSSKSRAQLTFSNLLTRA